MEGSVSILLGYLFASRTVSFCFSFGHVARYAPSQKTKAYGTIAENSSQANLQNLPINFEPYDTKPFVKRMPCCYPRRAES